MPPYIVSRGVYVQIDKLIEKIRSIPIRNDITLSEMDKFLNYYGFYFDRVSDNSHYLYKHIKNNKVIVFACPHSGARHIKPTYVRKILTTIDSLDLGD